jgi:Putative MetA-pathway of phenol degradation
MRRTRIRSLLLLATGLGLSAGPPFLTDDPEPVDLGHLELYLFSMGGRIPGESSGFGPALEFNYGILPDTQFHLIVPYAYDRTQGLPAQGGLGDTEVGIKYRFLHEAGALPQIGIFPFVEIPTGDADKRLGAGHTRVYLPIWAQKAWGSWTTYGGYGWWRNPGDGNRNWTYAGWLLQRDLGEMLTLGAEAFRTTATTWTGQASTGFNVGGQVNLSAKHHLLFSAGRNVTGETQTYFYLGYQLTTGPFGHIGDWFHQPHS